MSRGKSQSLYKYLPDSWIDFSIRGKSRRNYIARVKRWNSEKLVDINMDTYLHPEDMKEYIGRASFDDYCVWYSDEFKDVVTNVNKYKRYISENGTYERNSIFTYKKIASRQIEDSGHVITEYYSFVGKPFKQAMDESWNP